MKRVGHLWQRLLSDDNLRRAIHEVNRTHSLRPNGMPNRCTQWVRRTEDARIVELRSLIVNGFNPMPPKVSRRYDTNARKWRTINEPRQWPDQYVHHALVQVIQPVCMRGMDPYCCGSIRGRGVSHGKRAIERWMRHDAKGTRYCVTADIRHFYPSLTREVVMDRFRRLIKDRWVLDLIERVMRDGVLIGYYTSQWFANTVLQPMDVLIRSDGSAHHYVRYMDNLTIFGSNKRKLHRLVPKIDAWLHAHGMRLKGDWQVFATCDRLPDAMGYRYGEDFTIPRKHSYLKLKRALAHYRKLRAEGKRIPPRLAAGILSRLGQLKHCNNYNAYRRLLRGERVQRDLKAIVRQGYRRRYGATI